jgi:hypothetical protein
VDLYGTNIIVGTKAIDSVRVDGKEYANIKDIIMAYGARLWSEQTINGLTQYYSATLSSSGTHVYVKYYVMEFGMPSSRLEISSTKNSKITYVFDKYLAGMFDVDYFQKLVCDYGVHIELTHDYDLYNEYGISKEDLIGLNDLTKLNNDKDKCQFLFGRNNLNSLAVVETEPGSKVYKLIEADGTDYSVPTGIAKFPAWKDVNGKKVAYQKSVTVHTKLTKMVSAIFIEIFNNPEQFVVLSEYTGAQNIRANTTDSNKPSMHSFGVAIDVNTYYNGYGVVPRNNSYLGTKFAQFVISEKSSITKIFKKYDWEWGGEFSGTKDGMHFQWGQFN